MVFCSDAVRRLSARSPPPAAEMDRGHRLRGISPQTSPIFSETPRASIGGHRFPPEKSTAKFQSSGVSSRPDPSSLKAGYIL